MKPFIRIIGMVLAGMLGAFIVETVALPLLGSSPLAERWEFLRRFGNRTTVVNPVQRVVVTENMALVEAINQLRPVVVSVAASRGGAAVAAGSGVIITADGLVFTSSAAAPAGASVSVNHRGVRWSAEVVRRDDAAGLVVLKVPASNLPVPSLKEFDELHAGERVFALGLAGSEVFVVEGIVSRLSDSGMSLSLRVGREAVAGAAVATVGGALVAIATQAVDGEVRVADTRAIRRLLESR